MLSFCLVFAVAAFANRLLCLSAKACRDGMSCLVVVRVDSYHSSVSDVSNRALKETMKKIPDDCLIVAVIATLDFAYKKSTRPEGITSILLRMEEMLFGLLLAGGLLYVYRGSGEQQRKYLDAPLTLRFVFFVTIVKEELSWAEPMIGKLIKIIKQGERKEIRSNIASTWAEGVFSFAKLHLLLGTQPGFLKEYNYNMMPLPMAMCLVVFGGSIELGRISLLLTSAEKKMLEDMVQSEDQVLDQCANLRKLL